MTFLTGDAWKDYAKKKSATKNMEPEHGGIAVREYYITLLDNTVDHCVSFDGQGFSDEFMEKYANQIAARQAYIENHNVDYDYVNLLLNDVSERIYYQGHDYGSGGFAENYCPNTFMNFNEDGTFTMDVNPNGQGSEMAALDEFLNSVIRSLSEERQTEALEFFGIIAENYLARNDRTNAEKFDIILELILDSQYSDEIAYIIAYLIEYEQAHPEFKDYINSVLTRFGMEDKTQYVDVVDAILNFNEDYFLIGNVETSTGSMDLSAEFLAMYPTGCGRNS